MHLPATDTATASAIWFPRTEAAEFREEALPNLSPVDIHVHTLASGISQGTELLVYQGRVPKELELDLPTLAGGYGFPIKFGYACVGRVAATGPDVRGIEEADLVFVHHPHQTEFVVPASSAVLLPSETDPNIATLLANLETAVNVLLDTNPRLGDRVAIFGQGVVGLLITQLLKRCGAYVLSIEPNPKRAHVSRLVGSDRVVENIDSVQDEVCEFTQGVGADIVIETSGHPSALDSALDCLAFQGTAVVVSWYGDKPVSLTLGGRFHRERLRIISTQVGMVDPALTPRWNRERRVRLAVELLQGLELRPLISHLVPFRDGCKTYARLGSKESDTLQVVFTYGEDDV